MNKEKNSKSRWQSRRADFYPKASEEKQESEVEQMWKGPPVAVRREGAEVCVQGGSEECDSLQLFL